ncbi:MAG: hypothetical protein RLZZ612_832 [Pseudomonadota bacterium]
MNYYSLPFLLFFLIVFVLHWRFRHRRGLDQSMLLCVSWSFYAAWNPVFLPILLGFSAWVVGIGRWMLRTTDTAARRRILSVGIAGAVLNLAWFKYYEFVRVWADAWLGAGWVPAWDVWLPVGISFYTFAGISYWVDLYRNQLPTDERAYTPLEVALFIGFFPAVLAGPISRATHLLPQLRAGGKRVIVNLDLALTLMGAGLFKKMVISSYLASELVNPVFSNPQEATVVQAWLAMYGYAAQIYCDFSGYTDLTMGMAMLLGFRLLPNFAAPYTAVNLRDFWQRWHMSLSTWIRDYLYIALGGNRQGLARTVFNLMVAMLISGLWHGAGANYLVWGALHGAGVATILLLQHWFPSRRDAHALRRGLAWLLTLHFVMLAWVFFRASSISEAWAVLTAAAQGWPTWDEAPSWIALALILMGLGPQFDGGRLRRWSVSLLRASTMPIKAFWMTLWVYAVLVLAPAGIAPFIYANY